MSITALTEDEQLNRLLLDFAQGSIDKLPERLVRNNLTRQISDVDPYFFVHALVYNERLQRVSAELLTKDVLTFATSDGWTAVHYAASNNTLDTLPILTKDMLCMQDETGVTPLHIVCKGFVTPNLGVGRDALLTERILMQQDSEEDTPIYNALYVAVGRGLKLEKAIPAKWFTTHILMSNTPEDSVFNGCCPLEVIKDYEPEYLSNFLRLDLPDSAREIIGEDWWQIRQDMLNGVGLENPNEAELISDIDLT